jgi:hypothetical protein
MDTPQGVSIFFVYVTINLNKAIMHSFTELPETAISGNDITERIFSLIFRINLRI